MIFDPEHPVISRTVALKQNQKLFYEVIDRVGRCPGLSYLLPLSF